MPKMENIAKTFYSFFNSIMPSYLENYVPVNTQFPYLTYQLITTNKFETEMIQIRIFSQSSSLVEITKYMTLLNETISEGLNIPILEEKHHITFYMGNPPSQLIADEDPNIKSALINLEIQII